MFTSQVVRAVLQVARIRYVLLGAAGAGAVSAKMVGVQVFIQVECIH